MTKKNGTKRSLLMSAVALVLCFSMLVGSTFAWFTDSVTSSGNIIKSGKLDVEMSWLDGKSDPTATTGWTDASSGAIFNYSKWEPGYVDAKHIKIENVGNLAFNYQLHIVPNGTVSALANVIDVYFADNATAAATRDTISSMQYVGTLASLIGDTDGAAYGKLYPVGNADSTKIVTIALKMQESAGNEYQELSIGTDFSVQLIANQLTYEEDSFGSDYDTDAEWPVVAKGSAPVDTTSPYMEITVYDKNHPGSDPADPGKIAVVTVTPAAATDDNGDPIAENIDVTIVETSDPVITVAADQGFKAYDIKVTGIDGSTPVKVALFVGEGLTGIQLYHNGTPINSVYSGGYLTFESATFSPFTVVYDAVSTPSVNDNPNPDNLPDAKLTNVTGNYGDGYNYNWSGLDEDEKLNVVYEFSMPDSDSGEYDDWYCDFYVSVDRDLPEGQIILGGNYGTYGWIGFTNPEISANTEVALLASAVKETLITRGEGSNQTWTYESIKGLVKTFLCGVGEYSGATEDLSGMTFTVNLSLTNPENPAQYYNVETVTYTFP